MKDGAPKGRPPKTGADKTTLRTFRLTDEQYEKVRAFVRELKKPSKE